VSLLALDLGDVFSCLEGDATEVNYIGRQIATGIEGTWRDAIGELFCFLSRFDGERWGGAHVATRYSTGQVRYFVESGSSLKALD
jgi:hypothetical protein